MVDGACAALWIIALLALAVGVVWGGARLTSRQRLVPSMRQVVLPRGGTLWNVAVDCTAPGQDPRAIASEIRRLNRLHPDQMLHPGTHLLVPDYRAGAAQLAQNSQDPS